MHKIELQTQLQSKSIRPVDAALALGYGKMAATRLKQQSFKARIMDASKIGLNPTRKRIRYGKYDQLERKLLTWIDATNEKFLFTKIGLTRSMICQRAAQEARILGFSKFNPASGGWFDRFSNRFGVSKVVLRGEEAADVNKEKL